MKLQIVRGLGCDALWCGCVRTFRGDLLAPPSGWHTSPPNCAVSRAMTSFLGFLDHTRRAILGRTPLDEWSARRSELYLRPHNNLNRHPCLRRDLDLQSKQVSSCRPTALEREATGTSLNGVGPIGLAYLRYIFLFYGTSPTSKPKVFACVILSSLAFLALWYFSTLSHKRHNLKRKLLNTKRVFWFSLQIFFWNIFHSKKKWKWWDKKFVLVFMSSTRYSC